MEKEKMTVEQVREVTKTFGKKWLENQIFKNIRQAAEHGETSIVWDFEHCMLFVVVEIQEELRNLGYYVDCVDEDTKTVLRISW